MPPYICMSPVHKQHKERKLCQTKGVSICPHRFRCHHMLGYHLYVGMPPLCLDVAICLDAPPVCLNATLCLNTPICLDTPVCLDVPICLDTFICLDAHSVCLDIPHMFALPICLAAPVCLHAPYLWTPLCMVGHLHTFGHPLYVLMSSICLASPCVFGCGHPNIWECPNVLGASKHTEGYPNIWGHPYILGPQTWMGTSKHMGESKHIGGHPNIWGIQTYSGCIQKYWAIQTNGGVQTWRGTSKHVGAFQTYKGHPNIKGASKMWVVSKHMGHQNIQ